MCRDDLVLSTPQALTAAIRPIGKANLRREGRRSENMCTNESVIVEIRAAEGGADARLLVAEQFAIYASLGDQRRL